MAENKQFNLSEKIEMYRKVIVLLPKEEQEAVRLQINAIEFDVKEFIRLLKEFIKDNQEEKECNYILEKIDKLAGDKLI